MNNNGVYDYQEVGPDSDNDGVSDACQEEPISAKKDIYNIIDDENPVFFIEGIEDYKNNSLKIYNRWGVIVFAADGYNNTWDLVSTRALTYGKGEKLPIGTYFYVLELGDGSKPLTGWLYVNN